VHCIRNLLQHPGFAYAHRQSVRDFTRTCPLNFCTVLLLVLQKSAKSVQNHLHEFFAQLSAADFQPGPKANAWTQARAKLEASAFRALNQQAVLENFYHPDNPRRDWYGHRLLAVDGSKHNLPNSRELGNYFGWVVPTNQSATAGAPYVQGRVSVLYDVDNALGLDGVLERTAIGERALAERHWAHTQAGDVLVYDRGYCGYEWLARHTQAQRDFIVRVPRGALAAADALFAANQEGVSQRVVWAAGAREQKHLQALGLPVQLEVRLVTVRLSTGELEVLLTSLLDEGAYPVAAFAEAYHRRWGVEGFYSVIKGRLELENFSGRTLESVRQDFEATLLISNLESVLCREAQEELQAPDPVAAAAAAPPTHCPMGEAASCEAASAPRASAPLQVNRAVAFNALKNQVIALFTEAGLPLEEVLNRLTRLFLDSPVRQRPGRVVPRRRKSSYRSLRYQRYVKKVVF
jgi:hypothetical protein